jgi:hypothetical protein
MLLWFYGNEKTNSYRPEPYHYSDEPFPAFRGGGARYRAFLAVAKHFKPTEYPAWTKESYSDHTFCVLDDRPSLLSVTAKGNPLLMPCEPNEDQVVALITMRGGFRGGFGKIGTCNAQIKDIRQGNIHCCPTAHVVAVLEPGGFVFSETGRRSYCGLTEIYGIDGYHRMPTEEFEVLCEHNGYILKEIE